MAHVKAGMTIFLAAVLLIVPAFMAATTPAPDLPALLDAYASGDHGTALVPLDRLKRDEIIEFRKQLVGAVERPDRSAGAAWIAQDPAAQARRALVAAAFALEAEVGFAERGYWSASGGDPSCPGRCVVEWACTQLRARGAPDEAERVWMLATVALAGGVRNWTFLLSPITAPQPRTRVQGHVIHALERFPDEPRLRLARAMAIASRHLVMEEMDAPRAGERTGPVRPRFEPAGANPSRIVVTPSIVGIEELLRPSSEYAKQELAALAADSTVGAEARMRLAYLHLQSGAYESAGTEAAAAASTSADADLRYLAHFIAGQAAQTRGELSSAESHYRSALAARPRAQSATLALAALVHSRGDANAAYDLVAGSQAAPSPAASDPWRGFMYGDFPRLPMLIAELRRLVAP
jgi:hypothetical protein